MKQSFVQVTLCVSRFEYNPNNYYQYNIMIMTLNDIVTIPYAYWYTWIINITPYDSNYYSYL